MKILVVSDSSIYAIGHSFIRSLKELGHEAEMFDVQSAIDRHIKLGKIGKKIHTFWPVETWIRKGNRELAVFFQRFQPDHVIVSGNAPVQFGTLAFWKSIAPDTIITLFWPDTLTNLQQTQLNCASIYDQVASYSMATLPVFKQLGYRKTIWIPFAGDVAFLGTVDAAAIDSFKYDLTFIGGWRPEREQSVLSVLKTFPDLKVGVKGGYWATQSKHTEVRKIVDSTSIFGKAFGDYIRASRINLNVIDDTNYPAANMRFFEVPAAGGLQLCSSCPEQEDIFREGEHVYYFKNNDALCEQVNHILQNPEEAMQVRTNGHNFIESDHTYKHRLMQILASETKS